MVVAKKHTLRKQRKKSKTRRAGMNTPVASPLSSDRHSRKRKRDENEIQHVMASIYEPVIASGIHNQQVLQVLNGSECFRNAKIIPEFMINYATFVLGEPRLLSIMENPKPNKTFLENVCEKMNVINQPYATDKMKEFVEKHKNDKQPSQVVDKLFKNLKRMFQAVQSLKIINQTNQTIGHGQFMFPLTEPDQVIGIKISHFLAKIGEKETQPFNFNTHDLYNYKILFNFLLSLIVRNQDFEKLKINAIHLPNEEERTLYDMIVGFDDKTRYLLLYFLLFYPQYHANNVRAIILFIENSLNTILDRCEKMTDEPENDVKMAAEIILIVADFYRNTMTEHFHTSFQNLFVNVIQNGEFRVPK